MPCEESDEMRRFESEVITNCDHLKLAAIVAEIRRLVHTTPRHEPKRIGFRRGESG